MFLREEKAYSKALEAYKIYGPEILELNDGKAVAEIGQLQMPTNKASIPAFLQDIRSQVLCDMAWTEPPFESQTHTHSEDLLDGDTQEESDSVEFPKLDGLNPPQPSIRQ